MPLPTPAPGLVISYAYLWKRERRAGVGEGRKDRPCAIVLAVADADGDRLVYVAPITHTPPDDPANAIELPAKVKQRLGLDAERSWIVTDELNKFVWPGFDLRPVSRSKPDVFAWGFLPTELFEALKRGIAAHQKARRLHVLARD
ncbi:hypothetical protein [Azospirillum rugosum]|uniref:Growth inhibitor PemK n=1 Tax=Azospirillum rugosum TaxID=416170 RepID=A0ABS4ST33_9PROT|nr:hypothetical protein [Azospirillum rugosum]MBP2295399.1 hypothetical protein [Azospirillum rugosum]MDQ0528774.1 hypothetical protein [Azospirillum rugosum]